MTDVGLMVLLGVVFALPLLATRVEHQLELFLLAAGVLAAIIAGVLDPELLGHALREPIAITIAVLVAGLLFKWFRDETEAVIPWIGRRVPVPVMVGGMVAGLALLSSVITAIIASLFLASFIHVMRVHPPAQRAIAIPACFAIGFGAILTPIGEPLSTILTAKLDADFWFLARTFWPWVAVAIISSSLIAAVAVARLKTVIGEARAGEVAPEGPEDDYRQVAVRTLKVYGFVVGLSLLGAAYTPLVDRYLVGAPAIVMYGAGLVSAVLDNATLAAAAVSPAMDEFTRDVFVISLMVSGGMLIPGNIPNIVSAGRLRIGSGDWARVAVPIGVVMLAVFGLLLAAQSGMSDAVAVALASAGTTR